MPRPAVVEDSRLAAVIASRLTDEIVGADLQPGTHVGTEAELMERFDVSRDPLREAIRILEWQGLVAPSRGRRGGGLRVLAPGMAALSGMLRTYLQLSDISMGEVLECMAIVNSYLYQQVMQRATRAQIARMREQVARARVEYQKGSRDVRLNVAISAEIVSAAPNYVGRVLLHALMETSVDFVHTGRLPRRKPGENMKILHHFDALIDAMEARDFDGVMRAHQTMLREAAEDHSALEHRNSKIWNNHSFLMGDYTEALLHMSGRQKLAAAIGYQIAAYIRRNELAPGSQIIIEAAGIKEPSVSRAVLREAFRLLEFFGVIQVRRGNEGGLYAISPNPAHILVFAQIYFRHMNLDPKQIAQLGEHLGMAAAKLCAAKLSTAGLLAIRHQVEQFDRNMHAEAAATVARDLGRLIFSHSGNRALLLFGEVLFLLMRSEPGRSIEKIHRPIQAAERCQEAVAQLSTAFLKSNEAEMVDALNTLLRVVATLA